MNDKLIFFNSDGYPYNFEYRTNGDYYNGTLFFEENSSDTFKTLALYVFEKVGQSSFQSPLSADEFSVFNYSGNSFRGLTYSGLTVSNIQRVNTAQNFYSKWVYGDNFDTLFPSGTIVSFSNVNFSNIIHSNEFKDTYYQVVDNKPNAILINTKTSNKLFSGYTYLSGGTINSHNAIIYNDYSNGSWSQSKLTELQTYLSAKQLTSPYSFKGSIVGSLYNDMVTDITLVSTAHTYYQTFIFTGTTGQDLNFNFELYTERPKIYQGSATFSLSGTSALITLNRPLNSLINLSQNQTIIFESYDDNPILPGNPIFTINDGILEDDIFQGYLNFYSIENSNATLFTNFTNKSLSSQNYVLSQPSIQSTFPSQLKVYDYYIEFSGNTTELSGDLKVGDKFQVSALTSTPSVTLHENREFTVKEIITFEQFRIQYWVDKINSDANWCQVELNKAVSNGITVEEQIYNDAVYMYQTNDVNLQPTTVIKVDQYVIDETGNQYNIKKIFGYHEIRDLECTSSVSNPVSAFTMDVVGYTTSNEFTFVQTIASTYSQTIDLFNNRYSDYLRKLGIIVYYNSGLTENICIESRDLTFNNQLKYFDVTIDINNVYLVTGITNSTIPTLVLETSTQLKNEDVYIFETGKTSHAYHGEIEFDLIDNLAQNNGFSLFVNDIEYYSSFTGDTQMTLNSFIATYQSTLSNNGVLLSTGTTISSGFTSSTGNTLIIDGNDPDINVYKIEVKVNSFSKYMITKNIFNNFTVVDCASFNGLNLSPNFFDLELSTGMIIDVSGSSYVNNNGHYNIIGLTENSIDLSYQGPFFSDTTKNLSITSRPYIRKPRGNYGKDVYYNFKFEEPYSETIFFYDMTGEHLTPYLNDPRLQYVGETPLYSTTSNNVLYLQDEPNKDINYVSDPTKQQTVWKGTDGNYCLKFKLDRLDSLTNYNYVPEPLQVFLGFNSTDEGAYQTAVVLDKVEYVTFSGYTNKSFSTGTTMIGPNFTFTTDGLLTIDTNIYNFDWKNYGFEDGQDIIIDFIDQVSTGSSIFPNPEKYRINSINRRKLQIVTGTTLTAFSTTASTFKYIITVQPQTILKLRLQAESEIEDDRFRVNLTNLGLNLNYEDEHIFRESDIQEDGYDYILLNRKRKELLSNYTEIYNYIGSYKALINSINFFGYNELELYEYYRNIDPNSELYQKLHKVLIPDIFDNSVVGYNPQNYIKEKYSTRTLSGQTFRTYKKTNLFNLTYKITDEDGNNITLFSLEEVQIKLNKLKRWLKRNVIPLSSNIIDITGVASTVNTMYQNNNVSNQIKKSVIEESTVAINFNYSLTQNFDTNYLVQIDFYTHSISPSGWTAKIQTFSKDVNNKLIPQQYYKLMKNDLSDYSINIDKVIDQYLFVETSYYNERGIGIVYNKMVNTSTSKNYILVNNNFNIPKYNYLNTDGGYYFFDENGFIYLKD